MLLNHVQSLLLSFPSGGIMARYLCAAPHVHLPGKHQPPLSRGFCLRRTSQDSLFLSPADEVQTKGLLLTTAKSPSEMQ